MILLTGIPSEAPLALVIEAAIREGIPYVLFNQRLSHYYDMVLNNESGLVGGVIRIDENDYNLNDFAGIYVRLMDHQFLPETSKEGILTCESELIRKAYIIHDLLQTWFECTNSRIMNRGSDMGSNLSKPYQAQYIRSVGLSVPETVVTNSIEVARDFSSQHGEVIFKSISSVRSIVQKLDSAGELDFERLKNLPTQFQAYVPGDDIRVHIAGDEIFATEIKSQAVDYRYARSNGYGVTMGAIDLPGTVQEMCFRLSELLKLPLCGIDLRKTPDGEYFCFEVNPCPGYSYYQEQTGQDIATAIVRYLEFGPKSNELANQTKEGNNANHKELGGY